MEAKPSSITVLPQQEQPSTKAKTRRRRGSKKTGRAAASGTSRGDGKLMHLIVDSGAIIKGAGMTLASASEVTSV